jgi:hypothetical protein
MINGMIAGLVVITPGAGYVTGFGAIVMGCFAGSVPWLTMNLLGNRGIFKRVDDTLGVIHTHGFTGMMGGLLTGVLASPNMVQYPGTNGTADSAVTGLAYGNPHQLVVQAFALAVIIAYNAVATFIILKLVSLITPLRMTDAELNAGDEMLHGEVAFDFGTIAVNGHEPVPELAGVPVGHVAAVDSTGQPIASQLRQTLGSALGVDPAGLELMSGEQAAKALARHAALEDRLRKMGEGGNSPGPSRPTTRTRSRQDDD